MIAGVPSPTRLSEGSLGIDGATTSLFFLSDEILLQHLFVTFFLSDEPFLLDTLGERAPLPSAYTFPLQHPELVAGVVWSRGQ